MTDSVSFVNKGLIDPRCITTIGVSVKEGENPIGYFGTGLKYAIAIILRCGGRIIITSGMDVYEFTAKPVEIRGQKVDVVYMNGQELGFTTALGRNWEVWQAFREIYCNAMDEGGAAYFGVAPASWGMTTVCVVLDKFVDCLVNVGNYVLQSKPIHSSGGVQFHPGPSNSVFYRSIRVMDVQQAPFYFAPNIIGNLELTEDRTVKNQFMVPLRLADALFRSDDPDFIARWLSLGDKFAEHTLDLDWPSLHPGETFLRVVEDLYRDASRPINRTAVAVLCRNTKVPEPAACDLLGSEELSMRKAIDFCKSLGYPVDEFPITVVESLGNSVLGRANPDTRAVAVARRTISMGDLTLAATLIEEWAHLKFGFADCSREMQNWLLEQLGRLGSEFLLIEKQRGKADGYRH